MKIKKVVKLTKMIVLSMIVSLILQTAVPGFSINTITVQAAQKQTVKLNATKKTLTVGKTYQLKVKGTTKKATWSSSKKSVATVSKTGKVTAVAVGTATITAKVNNKKYTCKVTVKAPFEVQNVSLGTYSASIPTTWKTMDASDYGASGTIIIPSDADLATGSCNIVMMSSKNGATQSQFETYKEMFEKQVTEDLYRTQLSTSLGADVTLKGFTMKTVKKGSTSYEQVSYSVYYQDKLVLKQIVYYLFADGYMTEITLTDNLTDTKPLVGNVADYLLRTMTYNK